MSQAVEVGHGVAVERQSQPVSGDAFAFLGGALTACEHVMQNRVVVLDLVPWRYSPGARDDGSRPDSVDAGSGRCRIDVIESAQLVVWPPAVPVRQCRQVAEDGRV